MRARNIKPGFFKNEELAEIEPIGRLLFQGLWCMADREGRLEDRPRRIKIEVLPYDNLSDQKIGALLNILHEKNFILRYKVNASNYIQIIKFKQHQHVNIKECESTIPAPNLYPTNTELLPNENAPLLNPPYPILNPSTPLPPKGGNDEFFSFWEAYPKKVGKTAALKAWKKNGRPGIEKILEAISKQRASPQWLKDGGQFIPNPATWLNQGRWDDEVEETDFWETMKEKARKEDEANGQQRADH